MAVELIVAVDLVDPAEHGAEVDAGQFLAVLAHGAVGSCWLHTKRFGAGEEQRAQAGRLAERVNQAGMISTEHWDHAVPARELAEV